MPSLLDQTTRPSLENKILCFEVCDVKSSAELGPIAARSRVSLLERRNPGLCWRREIQKGRDVSARRVVCRKFGQVRVSTSKLVRKLFPGRTVDRAEFVRPKRDNRR
jgi:hypothetical protein